MWLFGLRKTYEDLFEEQFGPEIPVFEAVAQEFAPNNPDLLPAGRTAILEIGGHETWAWVLSGRVRAKRLAIITIFLGSIWGVFNFLSGASALLVGVYIIITEVVAFIILAIATSAYKVPIPSAPSSRRLVCCLGMLGLVSGAWFLWHWETSWGRALFVGVSVAVVVLFLLALWCQALALATAAIFRYTWSQHTPEEIIETLANVISELNQQVDLRANTNMRLYAADELDHVASCVERYLPVHLAGRSHDLGISVVPRCQRMGAAVRNLAIECLLPVTEPRIRVRNQVSHLLIAAVQECWGAWKEASVCKEPTLPRWRRSFSVALQIILSLLPIVGVVGGAIYLYRTDPKSKLLDPQILGPILVAAFGPLAHFLTLRLNPRKPTRKPEGS